MVLSRSLKPDFMPAVSSYMLIIWEFGIKHPDMKSKLVATVVLWINTFMLQGTTKNFVLPDA